VHERDDTTEVVRVFCIKHRIDESGPECAKLLEVLLKKRRAAAVGGANMGSEAVATVRYCSTPDPERSKLAILAQLAGTAALHDPSGNLGEL
jgi:hypothetical protein